MNELGLSTCWNASRHKDGYAIIDEIRTAGFDSVELNFTLTKDIVDSISSMVDKGEIKVRSLHNYCPIPEGVKPNRASPDYYSLASLDEDERKKAVYFTKQTVEQARALDAEAVVLHCGKVKARDYTRRLIALYEEGQRDSAEFIKIREGMFFARREKAKAHFQKVLKSLDELSGFAKMKNIILGIENRFYLMEIPSIEEIGLILKEFRGSATYYWHDVGHAQVFEELGFASHKEILEGYSPEAAGMHFHDIKGVEDHLAPGHGNFDFSILKPYLKNSVIKIIEAHHTESIDEVRYAKEYLGKVFRMSNTR